MNNLTTVSENTLTTLFSNKMELVQDNYKTAGEQFLQFVGDTPITPDSVKAFHNALKDGTIMNTRMMKPYSPASITLKVKAVKSIIRQIAFENPHMTQAEAFSLNNQLNDIKVSKKDQKTTETEYFTLDQVKTLLSECKDKKALVLIRIMLMTGCRINEALQLNYDLLKPSGKGMFLQENVIGKGDKLIDLKITAELVQDAKKCWRTEKGLMFPISRVAGSVRIKRAIDNVFRTGPDDHYSYGSAHMLRHTTATLVLQNGATITEVQSLLNHSSADTTARTYLHGSVSDTTKEFIKKLGSL